MRPTLLQLHVNNIIIDQTNVTGYDLLKEYLLGLTKGIDLVLKIGDNAPLRFGISTKGGSQYRPHSGH